MYKVVILAVLLTLGACAIKKTNAHFQDTKTVLAELDKDPLGNTILSSIAVNLKAKEPVEDVVLLLQEILTDQQSQQAQADARNQTNQAIYDETITNFKQQINEQVATISSLETAIQENTEILVAATADLEVANKDYDETVDAINSGTAKREAEHSSWADQDYKQSVEIATLEEGVKLIQHMVHGVAFAQIKSRYEKVIEKLTQEDGKRSTLYKPLILQLTQLASKLNYENVMKILDLLNGIRQAVVEEQTSARLAEETAQNDWAVLLNQLENQKQALSAKKQRLNNLIDSTTQLLKQLKESLEQHRTELENLQISLTTVVNQQVVESQLYETETADRHRNIDVLEKLINHLTERGGAVGDYLENRQL